MLYVVLIQFFSASSARASNLQQYQPIFCLSFVFFPEASESINTPQDFVAMALTLTESTRQIILCCLVCFAAVSAVICLLCFCYVLNSDISMLSRALNLLIIEIFISNYDEKALTPFNKPTVQLTHVKNVGVSFNLHNLRAAIGEEQRKGFPNHQKLSQRIFRFCQ